MDELWRVQGDVFQVFRIFSHDIWELATMVAPGTSNVKVWVCTALSDRLLANDALVHAQGTTRRGMVAISEVRATHPRVPH